MQNSQNLTIGLLVVTAIILGAMLLTSYMDSQNTAYADTPIKGGDYLVGTGAWNDKHDLLYVIDIGTRRMVAYSLTVNKDRIQLVDAVDLEKAFSR